jgi:hypothetical protein
MEHMASPFMKINPLQGTIELMRHPKHALTSAH